MNYKTETIEYYNQHSAEFVEGTINADMSEVYAKFERYLSSGSYILDLGCGSGRDTLHFLQRGYQVMAVDGSEEMCKAVASICDAEVKQMLFDELDYDSEFDAVWACASLLHIQRADLPGALKRVYKALKPGGVLYASFKYGEGERTKDGRFFTDMTEATAEEILKAAGFEIVETFITGDVREGRGDQRWVNVIAKTK